MNELLGKAAAICSRLSGPCLALARAMFEEIDPEGVGFFRARVEVVPMATMHTEGGRHRTPARITVEIVDVDPKTLETTAHGPPAAS